MVEIEPKDFWDDLKWGREKYPELVRKYPDKWVAIVDKKIVAVGESIKKIEDEAEKKTGKPKEVIPVIFIECGSHVY